MMKKPVKTGKLRLTLMQELISVVEEITDFNLINIETIVKDWMTKTKLEWEK
jgi:hypothetical protein